MPITLSNISGTGNFKLVNNTNSGRFAASIAASAAPSIVTSGLVLNLDAGNASSYSGSGAIWYDLTANANNAALVNNPTFTNSGVSSYFNFPYSNVYGQINDAASIRFGTGDFTISIWDYPLVVNDGTNQRTLISKNYTGFEIFIYQNLVRGYFGGVNQLITSTTLNINTWYNFVFVRSSGIITAYINSTSNGTLSYSGNVSNTGTALFINKRPSTSLYGQQNMSNIMLYNVALTSGQVTQNFNALKSRYGL